MLPWKIARGKKAFKNLRVFIGLPEQFKNKTLERLESADVNRLTTTYISLENVSIAIGAKKRW
jgi:large subunit ribosomal protein L13